jgi:hypothetical protein
LLLYRSSNGRGDLADLLNGAADGVNGADGVARCRLDLADLVSDLLGRLACLLSQGLDLAGTREAFPASAMTYKGGARRLSHSGVNLLHGQSRARCR